MYIERGLFLGVGSHDYGGWQVQNVQGRPANWKLREEPMFQLKSKACLLAECPLVQWRLVLFRPSADWMGPTHIKERNLLYSKSTNLNVDLI